jgi:hypothetical protein
MVTLPVSLSATSAWQLVDWIDEQQSSAPATGGVATVEFDQLEQDEMWLIDHAVIQCPGENGTVLRIYDGGVHPLRLLDGSDRGDFDVADWPAGLRIRPSSFLVAQWVGVLDGSVATLTLQARRLRRS